MSNNAIIRHKYKVIVGSIILILLIPTYIRLWEYFQPKEDLRNVQVVSIFPYHRGGGDLHWSIKGYRVFIDKDNRPIDFPIDTWDESIQVYEYVNITVRKSFFGNELDGLEVHKIK
jgi:hypothetical protein